MLTEILRHRPLMPGVAGERPVATVAILILDED